MAPRRTILVVDDAPESCELFAAVFAEVGFDTVCAAIRAEAIQLASTRSFAAVLFDLLVPEWDGAEGIRTLRQLFGPRTPIIARLPIIDESMVAATRAAGATDLWTIPFDVEMVRDIVLRHCGAA